MKESFVNAWRTFRLVNSNIPNFHSSVSVILNVLWIVHAIKAYEMSACKSYKESGMNEKKMHSAPPSSTMVERCTVIYRKLCLSQCYPLQNWCEWITMSRLISVVFVTCFRSVIVHAVARISTANFQMSIRYYHQCWQQMPLLRLHRPENVAWWWWTHHENAKCLYACNNKQYIRLISNSYLHIKKVYTIYIYITSHYK